MAFTLAGLEWCEGDKKWQTVPPAAAAAARPGRQQAAAAAGPAATLECVLTFIEVFLASQRGQKRTVRPGRPCGARVAPSPGPSPA